MACSVWREKLPATERELALQGLAFFTYPVGRPPASAVGTVETGCPSLRSWPWPACCCEPNDIDVLSEVIGRPIADPTELHAAQRQAPLDVAVRPSACPPPPSTEPEPHEETP